MIYLFIYLIVGIIFSMYLVFLPYLAIKEERELIFKEHGAKKGLYYMMRAGLMIIILWPGLLYEKARGNDPF